MIKRYDIKNEPGRREGWAILVIDTDIGYFSTVSDWGNYAYIWSSPGMEFRKFLTELEPDYLLGKLLHGRQTALRVFDGDETKLNILCRIEEYNDSAKERGKKWSRYEQEKMQARNRAWDDERDFEAWQSETTLDDAYELGCWRPDPQCTGFCTKVWPRFKKVLEEELAAEAALATKETKDEQAQEAKHTG